MSDVRRVLDGNAVAGLLREIFAVDMTVAVSTCGGCGSNDQIGSLRAYTDAPGAVMRCPHCERVVARIVHAPGRHWLDLRGATCLQIPEER